jgi:hypothetical protein
MEDAEFVAYEPAAEEAVDVSAAGEVSACWETGRKSRVGEAESGEGRERGEELRVENGDDGTKVENGRFSVLENVCCRGDTDVFCMVKYTCLEALSLCQPLKR